MIIIHVFMNILFWAFLIYGNKKIKEMKEMKEKKHTLFIRITAILGLLTYGAYIVVLIMNINVVDILKETCPLVILACSYMYGICVIAGKHKSK